MNITTWADRREPVERLATLIGGTTNVVYDEVDREPIVTWNCTSKGIFMRTVDEVLPFMLWVPPQVTLLREMCDTTDPQVGGRVRVTIRQMQDTWLNSDDWLLDYYHPDLLTAVGMEWKDFQVCPTPALMHRLGVVFSDGEVNIMSPVTVKDMQSYGPSLEKMGVSVRSLDKVNVFTGTYIIKNNETGEEKRIDTDKYLPHIAPEVLKAAYEYDKHGFRAVKKGMTVEKVYSDEERYTLTLSNWSPPPPPVSVPMPVLPTLEELRRDDLKEYIRALAGYKCQWCGKSQKANSRRLSVHIKDKSLEPVEDNLIALCMSCAYKKNRGQSPDLRSGLPSIDEGFVWKGPYKDGTFHCLKEPWYTQEEIDKYFGGDIGNIVQRWYNVREKQWFNVPLHKTERERMLEEKVNTLMDWNKQQEDE